MPRWIQKYDKETDTSTFVPADEAARQSDMSAVVRGDIEPFVSPIDGSIISGTKQMRDHYKHHDVVPTAEFSPEFLEKKRKEREKFYKGERTTKEIWQARAEINETINRLERERR